MYTTSQEKKVTRTKTKIKWRQNSFILKLLSGLLKKPIKKLIRRFLFETRKKQPVMRLFHQLFFLNYYYLKLKSPVWICYLFLFLDRDEVVCCWRPFDWKRTLVLVFYENLLAIPFNHALSLSLSRKKKKSVNGTYIQTGNTYTAESKKKRSITYINIAWGNSSQRSGRPCHTTEEVAKANNPHALSLFKHTVKKKIK